MLKTAIVVWCDLGVLPIGHLATPHPERAINRDVLGASTDGYPDEAHLDPVAHVEIQVVYTADIPRGILANRNGGSAGMPRR